ncbi:MAG TPA: sulfotransferase [Caulobacteraceae bacterium]|jgi:hypothetical protein|nr:sulfotransferase [Caulobacteraceae bacterium]
MTLKLIGAGFGRTGTMSLKLALEQIGFGPCYHMMEVFPRPDAPQLWIDAADGAPDWPRIFDGFAASVDWPGASFWRELADFYPDAKVLLTVRDPEAWYASTQATIFADRARSGETPFERMIMKVVGHLFPTGLHDKDHVIGVFERHNAAVQSAFGPDRLLTYEVSQGWKPLCDFLGVAVPDTPMPKTNTTDEFRARLAPMVDAALEGEG